MDDHADCAGRTFGLSRRLRLGHADAIPADHHPDLFVGGCISIDDRCGGNIDRFRRRQIRAARWLQLSRDGRVLFADHAGRAFSSMPGLASTIASQIRQGEIKRFLIQPVDLIGFLAADPRRP